MSLACNVYTIPTVTNVLRAVSHRFCSILCACWIESFLCDYSKGKLNIYLWLKKPSLVQLNLVWHWKQIVSLAVFRVRAYSSRSQVFVITFCLLQDDILQQWCCYMQIVTNVYGDGWGWVTFNYKISSLKAQSSCWAFWVLVI